MAASKVNAAALKRQMLARGWDGIDLAYHAGVSPATVSHAMSGLPVSSTTVRKLAAALVREPPLAGVEELLA